MQAKRPRVFLARSRENNSKKTEAATGAAPPVFSLIVFNLTRGKSF